jgi:hypothetical protein
MTNYVTTFVHGKAGGGANTGTTLETIVKGDILILDYDTQAVLSGTGNTITNHPIVQLAYCFEDGVPILTGPIHGSLLKSGGKNAYSAPVMAKKGFGYTSASLTSTLPALGATKIDYSGAIVYNTDLRLHPNRQDRLDFAVQSYGGYDLAKKLKLDINRSSDINPRLEGNKNVVANVTSNLSTAIGLVGLTYAVAKGTKTVTFSAAHSLTAGYYVTLADGYTYRIASVGAGNTAILDTVYAGATVTAATSNLSFKSADAVTEPTLIGVEVTALPIVYSNPVDKYNQRYFTIALSEKFTGLTEVTVASYAPGVGTGWQTRDVEIACMGNMGYTDRLDPMRAPYPFQTVIASNYYTVGLTAGTPVRDDLGKTMISPMGIFIAFDNAAATQKTAVMAILAPWALSGGVTLT